MSCFLILILISCCSHFMPYLTATSFSSTALATSSFHHHVSLCLSGPLIHPYTCSACFCTTLSVSNTIFLLYATSQANSCATLGSLSFHTSKFSWMISVKFSIGGKDWHQTKNDAELQPHFIFWIKPVLNPALIENST